MAEKPISARVAFLELRQDDMEKVLKDTSSELHTLNSTVREMLIYARISKRFALFVLTLGPSLGVVLAKLI